MKAKHSLTSIFFALVFIYSSSVFAGFSTSKDFPKKFSAQSHIYIVACGVDDYRPLYGNVKFNSAVNDIKNLSDSISKRFCNMAQGDCNGRIHVYKLLDEKATRKGITDVLADITKLMKSDDVLFFSFSGDMRDFVPDTKVPVDYPYLMTYTTDSSGSSNKAKFESEFLSLKELRTYLELMPCKYQMLLLDAGLNQKEIGWKFASTMLKNIPSEQNLANRKRILIAPDGTSVEVHHKETGEPVGLLSYAVAGYKPVLNLFFEKDKEKAGLNKYMDGLDLSPIAGTAAVFAEDEIMEYLRKFCQGCEGGGKRGAIGTNEEPDMVAAPVKTNKKDIAVIVATDTYQGTENWVHLKTAKNDAESVEKLLREKYGYETRLYLNYTKDSLLAELKKLVKDVAQEDQQLFLFFAGHGYYSSENLDGYLVMKDSKSLSEDKGMQSYFQFSYLSNFVNNLPYKHVFVMLDVCFGGSFGGNNNKIVLKPNNIPSDISIQEFRKRKKDFEGRLYLASGNREVDDVSAKDPNHSPFAEKVIDKFKNATATIYPQDIYQYCGQSVNIPVFRKLADHNDESEFFFTPVGSNK